MRPIKMDWLGMEYRLKVILRETEANAARDPDAWRAGIYRIDACVAAYTLRGHTLAAPSDPKTSALVDSEWGRIDDTST